MLVVLPDPYGFFEEMLVVLPFASSPSPYGFFEGFFLLRTGFFLLVRSKKNPTGQHRNACGPS